MSGSRILQPSLHFGIWKPRPEFATSNSFRKMCVLLGAGGRSRGGPFPKMWPPLNRVGAEFIGVTRKERPCFAAERGLDRLGHRSLRMVYWGHTKGNGAVLLQNAAPTPLGTHEHSRVHFLILGSGLPLRNRVGAEFIGATRKERPCFAAERGLDSHKPPGGLLGAHERNGAVLLQNAAPTPLGTHEHSRVHFLILGSGLPPAQPPFRDLETKAGVCDVKFFS